MSDVLMINSDGLSSPSIKMKYPVNASKSDSYSWGFSWYPNDHHAAMVVKDPAATDHGILSNALNDWAKFRSSVFMAKTKTFSKGDSYHEAQPFSKTYAGRDWTFIHNGNLDKTQLSKLLVDQSSFLEPMGKTDSELAFCFLIGQIASKNIRTISDVAFDDLLSWFKKLNELGGADILLSDGISTACYHGQYSSGQLYYTRVQPPAQQTYFESSFSWVDISNPRDIYRTYCMVSSQPFQRGHWSQMQPGQLLLLKKGVIVGDSLSSEPYLKPELASVCVNTNSHHSYQPMKGLQTMQSCQSQGQSFRGVMNARSITHTSRGKPLTYRLFEVSHKTTYRYAQPVLHSCHTFRLQPMEDPTQEVVSSNLTISSLGEEIRYLDVFGNHAIHYTIDQPYTHLSIHSVSKVKVYDTPPIDLGLSLRKSTIPLVWMPWQRQMLLPYRQPPELPEPQLRELTDYANSFVVRNDAHPLYTLKDMNMTIYRDYRYVPGSTSVNTTAFEVYANRKGVCQDFANLMICLARLLNIPARYRMGYIYTGNDYANTIQSDASHAWVEIYLPYIGWLGFDPTNGCMVRQDHVRVACGRHYRDATPTDGTIYKGGSAEMLNVDVKMHEIRR